HATAKATHPAAKTTHAAVKTTVSVTAVITTAPPANPSDHHRRPVVGIAIAVAVAVVRIIGIGGIVRRIIHRRSRRSGRHNRLGLHRRRLGISGRGLLLGTRRWLLLLVGR